MNQPLSTNVSHAVSRARWLGEVAAALDGAGRLALRLRQRQPGSEEVALLAHIKTVQREVESIRRGGDFLTLNPWSEMDALTR